MNVKTSFSLVSILLLLFSLPYLVHAQRRERPAKPTLLVYGSDVEAFSAAMQSAVSNVPTLWILDTEHFVPSLTEKDISFVDDSNVDGGVWKTFLKQVSQSKTVNDTIISQAKSNISARVAENELRNMLAKQSNLTVLEKATIKKLVKTKRGWTLTLSDRTRYDLRTLVDASANQDLLDMINLDRSTFAPNKIMQVNELSKELSRTVVAIGHISGQVYGFTRQDISKEGQGNFFVLNSLKQFDDQVETIPLRMNYAEALGAAAAYTAFFRKPLNDLDSRTLQKELLAHGARIAPYVDMSMDHPHFRAIERIYLSGVFDNTTNTFNGQDSVRFDEVAPVLNQLYSRSQLWFHSNKGDFLRLKDVVSLVKFLGMRGDDIDRQIERDWGKKMKFETDFDLERVATKQEFSVLLDMFSNPFGVRVDADGKIKR